MPSRPYFNSRSVLAAGFGGLLLIMVGSGIDAIRTLRKVRQEDEQIRSSFLSKNRVLNEIRSQLYLSGTYVRDYLLDPEPEQAESFRALIDSVHRQMNEAFADYRLQLSNSEQSEQFPDLSNQLSLYWASIEPILRWTPDIRRQHGYRYLRDELFPRRSATLALADRIAGINEQQLNAGNQRVEDLLGVFQTRLGITLGATLLVGVGMAFFSIRTLLRLEAASGERLAQMAEARRHLTNLSARLVDAQESERRALSRELHDEVGQSLSAVLVELKNLSVRLENQADEQLRTHVETIKGLTENTVRVVRNMALLLRPSMLDDLGLIPALRWQAREVSKQTGIDVTVAAEELEIELPDDYKTCIYRIVQEALHNCARHSGAAAVHVRVKQAGNTAALSIQDDGRGFDVRHSKGLGLLGIEERVAQVGGTCVIHSVPDGGTMITVHLPLAEPQKEAPRAADSYSFSG